MTSLRRNILIVVVMLSLGLSLVNLSGCMTVKGFASDLGEISGAVDRALEPAEMRRKEARLERAARLILEDKRSVETPKKDN